MKTGCAQPANKNMEARNQTNGLKPEFQVEGNIVYRTEIRNPSGTELIQHSRRFMVARKGRQWKIRTTNLQSDRFAYGNEYDEMGCDGETIHQVKSYDETNPNLSDVKNIIATQGWVRHGNAPTGFDLNFFYPLWIAYCSSSHFLAAKDNQVAAPLFNTMNSLLDSARPPFCLPAKWKQNESNFISEVLWQSEGKYLSAEIGANRLETYPPPFNAGFLHAKFETKDWIGFAEMLLPKDFVLTVFGPNWPAEGEAKCVVSYTTEAKVQAVRPADNFSFLPELTKITRITDTRYRLCSPCSGHPTYASLAWMTEDEVEAKSQSMGIKYEKQTSPI